LSAEEQTRFLEQLAQDLNSKNIELPSFPDVVVNIRAALEDPGCTSERLAGVVRTDAVLVARLLMAANSAFHNRAGIEILDLDLAISRLGFEVVRNTAITLAVEQIFNAGQHEDMKDGIKTIWENSLSLGSMCFVVAKNGGNLNADNAFLCGLFNGIGELYLLSKARDFPGLLGDADAFADIVEQWNPSVGSSIVRAWGFADDIVEPFDLEEKLSHDPAAPATLVDVVYTAKLIIDGDTAASQLADNSEPAPAKLRVTGETLEGVREAWSLHAGSMRATASGG